MATPRRPRTPRQPATSADNVELARFPAFQEDNGGASFAPPAVAETLSPTEARREIELEDVLEEVGSDGRVRVWHIIDGKSVYAGEMSVDGFTLDLLLDAYGGGEKSLAIYQGKTKKETVRVSLDPTIPPRNPKTPRQIPGQAAPAQGSGGNLADMGTLIGAMAQSQLSSINMMQTMMSMSQQSQTNMLTAMTAFMTARPEKDPMDVLAKVIPLINAGKSNADPSELFAIFEKGMNIAGKLGGKDDGESVMPIVAEGMKTLGSLVDGFVAEKKAKAAASIAAQSSAPTLPSTERPPVLTVQRGGGGGDPEPTIEETVNVRPWVDEVRPYMGLLLQAAKIMNPDAAASTINRNLSDESFTDLMDDIQDTTEPGFGVRLVQYFPAAGNVSAEWLGEVVRMLLESDEEDDQTTDTHTEG